MTGVPGPVQLGFRLGEGDLHTWAVCVRAEPRLELEIALTRVGLRVRVASDSLELGRQWWGLEARVTPPARLAHAGSAEALLLGSTGCRPDARYAALVLQTRMIACGWPKDVAEDDELPEEARAMLRDARRHLAALVDPRAAAAATQFEAGSDARWFVYAAAAGDRTGRVAQLATSCPGLLLLAHGLQTEMPRVILRAVVAGLPVDPNITYVLERWPLTVHHPRVLATRGLLVRRAGPLVADLSRVIRYPPVGLVPEDIPSDPKANAAWYAMMGAAPLRAGDHRLDEAPKLALSRFASRHAAALFEQLHLTGPHDDDAAELDRALGEVADYLRATGRVPSRHALPAGLLAQAEAWHRAQQEPDEEPGQMVAPAALPLGELDGLTRWRAGENEIVMLQTTTALAEESRRMHHCVRTYAAQALAGACHIFHGVVAGRPQTIEIGRDQGDQFEIVQAAGVCNRAPDLAAWRVLRIWLADLNATRGARRSGASAHTFGAFTGTRDHVSPQGPAP